MFCARWAKNIIKDEQYFTNICIPPVQSKSVGANATAKINHGY
jgi:hypothetical protein